MKDMKALAEEIAQKQQLIAIDPDSVDWRGRPGFEASQRIAREELVGLKAEYGNVIRSNSLGIVVTGEGDRPAFFAQVAAREADGVVVDAGALTRNLVEIIEPTLGPTRDFGPSQLGILAVGLDSVARKLGVHHMQAVKLSGMAVVRNPAETEAMVRTLIQEAVGEDLLKLYVRVKTDEGAVAKLWTGGSTLPVLVIGVTEGEIESVLTIYGRNSIIDVGTASDGEIDKQYVLEKLSSLRTKLKTGSTETSSTKPNNTNNTKTKTKLKKEEENDND
jgi:hypothetical protein